MLLARGGAERLPALAGTAFHAESLSASGEASEQARTLFKALRALDASTAEVLLAEPIEGEAGLPFALRDRLFRAAVKPRG